MPEKRIEAHLGGAALRRGQGILDAVHVGREHELRWLLAPGRVHVRHGRLDAGDSLGERGVTRPIAHHHQPVGRGLTQVVELAHRNEQSRGEPAHIHAA